MLVTKASGEREKFNPEKLKQTCLRAGAPEQLAEKVVVEVEKKIFEGISTKQILKIALGILDREMPHVAAKYDLKGAIMRLGPAGFEFENLIGELLREYGYQTSVHNILKGYCVGHEVDVIAEKMVDGKKETGMIECKYHNASGIFSGVKDVLYTYARFEDLQRGAKFSGIKFTRCWLASNTKFSSDVIKYANCMKITLIGWKYPEKIDERDKNAVPSLKRMLDEKRLYPITALRTIDRDSQEKLAAAGLMFCKDLVRNKMKELERTGISRRKLKEMIAEAETVCG
ncbi:MAG: restriction endonuclease [Nanoarchaeota archaeon]|nr:restriction endonuclease [Nanoarchaeota archaeon]